MRCFSVQSPLIDHRQSVFVTNYQAELICPHFGMRQACSLRDTRKHGAAQSRDGDGEEDGKWGIPVCLSRYLAELGLR